MHTKKGGFQMFRLLYLHLYPLVTFHTGNDMHLHILGVLQVSSFYHYTEPLSATKAPACVFLHHS